MQIGVSQWHRTDEKVAEEEIDDAARHMLAEMVVRHVEVGSDEWFSALAKYLPEATITDREYVAMRAVEMIEEWRRKNGSRGHR